MQQRNLRLLVHKRLVAANDANVFHIKHMIAIIVLKAQLTEWPIMVSSSWVTWASLSELFAALVKWLEPLELGWLIKYPASKEFEIIPSHPCHNHAAGQLTKGCLVEISNFRRAALVNATQHSDKLVNTVLIHVWIKWALVRATELELAGPKNTFAHVRVHGACWRKLASTGFLHSLSAVLAI